MYSESLRFGVHLFSDSKPVTVQAYSIYVFFLFLHKRTP